jgi:WD40 repeat protein
MDFKQDERRLFVGMDTGGITEFEVADDYNKITVTRNYVAHGSRVTQVVFSPEAQWLLSVSKDKSFLMHEVENGRRMSVFMAPAPCTAFQYDTQSKTGFVGDQSGQIHMLKLEGNNCRLMTTLKGHMSGIRSLFWDSKKQMLFSGGLDQAVVCWDIGGKRGTTYELQGHK